MGGELAVSVDGVPYVIEQPADGAPEIIWILDDDEGEFQVGDVQVGDFIPLVSSDEEDEADADNDEDTEDEDTDTEDTDEEDLDDEDEDTLDFIGWGAEDSGYGSMSEEEEEDVEDEEEPPAQRVERPADLPPVSPPSEDSAPPASGLSSSTIQDCDCEPRPSTSGLSLATKRSREDSDTPQLSVKRQRKTWEDCDEEPRPSTSGLSSSTHRGGEEDYRNSAPSTSGTSSSMPRRYWPSSFQYLTRPHDSDSDED